MTIQNEGNGRKNGSCEPETEHSCRFRAIKPRPLCRENPRRETRPAGRKMAVYETALQRQRRPRCLRLAQSHGYLAKSDGSAPFKTIRRDFRLFR